MVMFFELDEVVSVETVESTSLRYDITVDVNNNFFANNILVHNCQNLTKYWDQLQSLAYEVTEKIDGSSMTVGFSNDEFIVCSRNINLKETESNRYWITARDLDIESRIRSSELTHLVLQGELIGPGIQANRYKLTEYRYLVFSVFDQSTGQYLDPATRRLVVSQLNLTHVPVIYEEFTPNIPIDQVLLMADGSSTFYQSTIREGLVFKQIDGSIHWKAISNKFLLKDNS